MPTLPTTEKLVGMLEESSRFVAAMTPPEYIAFERTANERHEFWEGNVFRRAGGSIAHFYRRISFAPELEHAP